MGKDGGGSGGGRSANSFILSSKRAASCRYRGEQGREIEKLRAALEAERSKSRQAQRKLAEELRRLRETGERERRKELHDLTCRHEQEKALELLRLREALGKEREAEVRWLLRRKGEEIRAYGSGLEKERESARRQARELQRQLARELIGKSSEGSSSSSCRNRRGSKVEPGCLSNLKTYRLLEQLLQTLRWEADGEQAALVGRLAEELELEKSLFLRHVVEAHGQAKLEERGGGRQRSMSCTHLLARPAMKADPDSTTNASGGHRVSRSRSLPQKSRSVSPATRKRSRRELVPPIHCSSPVKEASFSSASSESRSTQTSPTEGWPSALQNSVTESAVLNESTPSTKCSLSDVESMVSPLPLSLLTT
ncbi:hypothetical protein AGOR_G00020880 [Albula goreensis]|uniref:Uncharacterized protein n=1 Tax=Albula goreensis TaxID=1534307 RepID=A0A8T3E0X5_9TELE|nr:hypothetical protein AGOR_G00020880 [Albula goreensis]